MSRKIPILLYHSIAYVPRGAKFKASFVTPRNFLLQMHYLHIMKYEVLNLDEALQNIVSDNVHKKALVLTFDDGYKNFYVNAFPVIKRYGFKATVFIVSSLLGEYNRWDIHKTGIRQDLLNEAEIKEMHSYGINFGAHGFTHTDLTKISHLELKNEIKKSKQVLEELLQQKIKFFAYPYGFFNDTVIQCLKKEGFICACTTTRGFVCKDDDPYKLKRIEIKHNTNIISFLAKLHW